MIKKTHPLWKIIDLMCFNSKNLYNEANYIIRQEYFKTNNIINYLSMNKEFKTHENYKSCGSQPANCTMRRLDKAWKSFNVISKDYKNNPEKYLGKPRPPNYQKKNGRYVWEIPNNTCYIEGNELHFRIRKLQSVKWYTQAKGRLIQVRFVPKPNHYMMEIVYETEVPDLPKDFISDRICSIDLGVNNLVTMTNNIGLNPIIINGKGIKSINQFYNKERARLQADVMKRNNLYWSNKLKYKTEKRYRRIKNYMHCTSKYIVKYCKQNNIDTLVCGINHTWKQEAKMNSINNQKFVDIPHDMLIKQLQYKCQDYGIKFIETEESYTSGTSFLDGEIPCRENYDKSRRVKRGLFQACNQLINSDVNGSLQIMRKVFPDAFVYDKNYGIEGILTPIVINVAKFAM